MQLFEYLFGYFSDPEKGILGVIVIVLGAVVVWQQKQLAEKNLDIKKLNEAVNLVLEKRIADNQQLISTNTSHQQKTLGLLEAVQRGVDGITRVLELRKLQE